MNKRNKTILISLCLILAICAISTAGVLIWKKTAEKAPVSEEVLIDGGEASVSDEAALRELLLKEEELVINLTEDITVDESLVIKGKKTLSGTGSIKMALYVMPYENVITVAENATLILDGVTVNGNGIANCIKVEKTANLTFLSGEVAWGNPYGIEVQGNAEIKGGTITDAIHTGVFVGTSGNVQMSAGNIKSAGYASTRISKGGYFCLSDDAILQNCGVYHIHNAGTCDVIGGVVRDSEYTLATTEGDLNIHYQGADGGMIEWYNATGSGIWVGEGGNLNASGFYVHDVGYAGVNSGQGTGAINMTNCKFENTGNNGLHIKMATAELKDIEIIKPGKHGVFVNSPTTTANIENLIVTEPAERGLHNAGGTVTAKNVTVTTPGTYGVSTGNSGKVAGSMVVENLTVTGAGTNPDNSQPAINSYKSSMTVIGATIKDSNNAGARVTDGGELTLKNVKIENTKSYGVYIVHNKSKATLENISVANTAKHGVYVNNGGAKATINKLTVTNAGERGLHNAGGTITAKNVTINGSGLYGVSTGNHTDSKTGKSTAGSVTIDNLTVTGAKGDSAVNSYKSVLKITNAKIKDSAKIGARATDGGTLKLTDVEITNTGAGSEGVLINSKAQATLKNVTVTNAGKHGVYVNGADSKADIDTLVVAEPAERGVHNAGGTITAKNVTVTSPGTYGVSTGNSGESTGSVTVTNLKVTNAGAIPVINEDGSKTIQPAVNSYNSVLTVIDAKLLDSNGVGARATDNGKLNLTNVEIQKTGQDGIYASKQAQINISGINTITDAGKDGICANGAGTVININTQEGAAEETDSLTVITPVQRGIRNEGAAITAKNVTVTDPGTYGVSTAKSGDSEGNVVVDNLTVTGAGQNPDDKQPAVNAHNGSVMTVNGAKISDCNNAGARATQGATLYLNDVKMTDLLSHGVYVEGADSKAFIDTLTITKSEEATYSAVRGIYNVGGTVEAKDVSVNAPKEYGVSTLSYTDKTTSVVTNGSMKIEQLTVSNAQGNAAVYANNSVLTVNKGTLSDSKKDGALVNFSGTLNLTDVDIINAVRHGVLVDENSFAYLKGLAVETEDTFEYTLNADIDYGDVRVNSNGYAQVNDTVIKGAKEYGIYATGTGAVIDVSGLSIEKTSADSERPSAFVDGIRAISKGTVNLSGINSISDTGRHGINAFQTDAKVNINTQEGATPEKDYLTITGVAERGICNEGGTIVAKNVKIENSGQYGVSTAKNQSAGSVTIDNLTVENASLKGKYPALNAYNGSVMTVNGGTIKNSKYIGARSEMNAVLNLNGVTIDTTGDYGVIVKNSATLNVTGLSSVKKAKTAGIYVENNSTANINVNLDKAANNLTITNGERGIYNIGGTVNAYYVTVKDTSSYGVQSEYSGAVTGKTTVTDLSVSGAKGTASIYSKGSELIVTDATITNSKGHGALINNGGILRLTDATIDGTATDKNGIHLDGDTGESKAYLTNVTIEDAEQYGVHAYGKDGYIEIDGLKVSSSKRGIANKGAIIKATDVEIDGCKEYSVSSYAYTKNNTLVSKGELTINNLTVTNSIATAVHVNESVLTINGGQLNVFEKYGAVVYTGGVLNLNNTTINAAGTSSAGKYGVYLESVYSDKISTLNMEGTNTIANATEAGVYVQANTAANISNTSGNLTITNCKNGIQNVGGTVTAKNVVVDTPEVYGVLAESGGATTITGLTVENAGVQVNDDATDADAAVFVNNSELTIIGTETAPSTITGSTKSGAGVIGGGVLNLENVAICNSGAYGVCVTDEGSVINANELSIDKTAEGYDGIRVLNKGTVNLSGINSISDTGRHGINAFQTDAKVNINTQEGATPEKDYLTITGVAERGICNEGGTIVAKNVKIENSGQYGVSTAKNQSAGSVTIDNLTVVNASASDDYSNPSINAHEGSVLTVNGAQISGGKNAGARVTNGATLNLKDVTINEAGNYGVYVNNAGSVANINGLTINTVKANDGIRVLGGATLNLSGVSIINNAKVHGIYVQVNSTVNINCEQDSSTGQYIGLPEESNNLTINNCGERGLYNVGGTVTAYHVETKNTGKYGVSLGAHTDEEKDTITRAIAAITDLKVNTTSANSGIMVHNSDATINEVTVLNAKTDGVVSAGGGVLHLTNATVMNVGQYGVSVEANSKAYVDTLTVTTTQDDLYTLNADLEYGDIRVQGGGYIKVEGVTLKGSKEYGVYAKNSGSVADISGLIIEKVSEDSSRKSTIKNAIHVTDKATLNLSGISSIKDAGSHGIYLGVNSALNINCTYDENGAQYVGLDKEANYLTITNPVNQGIKTDGGDINAYHLNINTINKNDQYGISVYSGSSGTVRGYANIHNLTTNNVNGNAAIYSNASDVYVTDSSLIDSKETAVWAYNNGSGAGKIWLTNVIIDGKGSDYSAIWSRGRDSVITVKNPTFKNIDETGQYKEQDSGEIVIVE